MFFIIVITGVALWKFLPKEDRSFLLALFILGMSLRILIYSSFYFASEEMAGRGEFVPDSRLYTVRAANMVRTWMGYPRLPYEVEVGLGRNGYLYILGFFYLLVGYIPNLSTVITVIRDDLITYSLFSDKLINCLIGTFTGIVMFYIAREIFNKKVAKIVSVMVVFFPSLVLWSMTNTREPISILLVALIILSIIKIQVKLRFKYVILLIGCLLLLSTIRNYVFLTTLIITLSSLIISAFLKCKKKILYTFLAIVFLLTSFNTATHEIMLKNKFLNLNNGLTKLYESNAAVLSQGGNYYEIYDKDALINGKVKGLKFIKAFFKGWFYFMLVPFPWSIKSIREIITYPQIIIWYLFLPFAFIGILFALRYRFILSLSLICYTLLLTSLLALVEGNIGSAMRHRDLVVPFYFIFSAAGLLTLFDGRALLEEQN